MLYNIKHIYTRPGKSHIHGIGLLAIRRIPPSTRICKHIDTNGQWFHKDVLYDNGIHKNTINMLQDYFCNDEACELDMVYCPAEFDTIAPQNLINHSYFPNTALIDGYTVSTEHIEEGEEITCNYLDICGTKYIDSIFNSRYD